MKQLVQAVLRKLGYELRSVKDPDVTAAEWEILKAVSDFTMLPLERLIANIRAIDYIVQNRIPGDVVECGVWRGGSCMAMALELIRCGDLARTLWLYDTFEGMTEPTGLDAASNGVAASTLIEASRRHEKRENSQMIAYSSIENVRANLERTGYPRSRLIKGPVERTIPGEIPESIALLRLDTDWHESTRHELIHLYPRLSPGGVLILDDYGHWTGARKAVDEYFREGGPFLNRVDYSCRLAVKPR